MERLERRRGATDDGGECRLVLAQRAPALGLGLGLGHRLQPGDVANPSTPSLTLNLALTLATDCSWLGLGLGLGLGLPSFSLKMPRLLTLG